MNLIQTTTLAFLQGLTEFLPISSSGHLILMPIFLGWRDQGLIIDVAVHIGTLGAVIIYLRHEVWRIISGFVNIRKNHLNDGAKLGYLLLIASLPVFIVGFIVKFYIDVGIRIPLIIGWSFIIGGMLLYLSDLIGKTKKDLANFRIVDAILIGVAQAFAIIPGASRAGTTVTMARFLGYKRDEAARISLLLSIPAILGAGVVLGIEIIESASPLLIYHVFWGTTVAFITAMFAISIMMSWLKQNNYTPFVIYRICLGIVILWFAA